MKYALLFLSILFFSVVISFGSFCEETQITEWAPYSGISGLSSKDGAIAFNSTSSMPLLASRDNIFINASRSKFLTIRMRSNKSYVTGRMFFKRIGDAGFNYNNSFEFQTGLNNMYHTYLVNLSRNPNWFGTVTQLMLSPINSEGSVQIADMKFLEPNMCLTAGALWQEFFTFEVPQLRTVNFIYGPKIAMVSVNMYIYLLIFFISVIIILVRYREAGAVFKDSAKKIIIICLVFWVALDLRILIDQARTVILDTQTFKGKTLDERRSLVTLNDYYDFLHFSDSAVPKGASFNLVHPTYYYYWAEKAMYYLSPRSISETADYILVYDPGKALREPVNEYQKKGFKMFATFKDGEFILKK